VECYRGTGCNEKMRSIISLVQTGPVKEKESYTGGAKSHFRDTGAVTTGGGGTDGHRTRWFDKKNAFV